MKILYATLIVLSFINFISTPAFAAGACETASSDPICKDHARGVLKPLRSVTYRLNCLQLSQEELGSVKLSLYGKDDALIRAWQNVKKIRDQMCIPISLYKKAAFAIVCGCKTKDNPEGRWQKINLIDPAQRKAWEDGKILPLCRNK